MNQTTGTGDHLSMWENRCMHARVYLLRAGQPRRPGDPAKSGQFEGRAAWEEKFPFDVRGLLGIIDEALYNPLTSVAIWKLLEVIGISAYFPRRLDRDRSPLGHKPDYRHGWSSEYVRKSMHACQCVYCVQASRDGRATRRNRVSSKVESRGKKSSRST